MAAVPKRNGPKGQDRMMGKTKSVRNHKGAEPGVIGWK